jgi:anti-anti-sigma factor
MSTESLHFDPPDEQDLLVRVDHDRDAALVRMTVSGDVDSISCGELRRAFTGAVDRHRPAVVVMDVRGVTFLDSAGIRTLVLCRDEALQADCHLTLVELPRIVHRVLEVSGLSEHFGLTPSDVPPRMPGYRTNAAG